MVPPEASACMLWGGIHRGTIGIDNNVQSLHLPHQGHPYGNYSSLNIVDMIRASLIIFKQGWYRTNCNACYQVTPRAAQTPAVKPHGYCKALIPQVFNNDAITFIHNLGKVGCICTSNLTTWALTAGQLNATLPTVSAYWALILISSQPKRQWTFSFMIVQV